MDERQKLLYILVVPDEEEKGSSSFCYTRQFLQSSLQMMGCKPRHAFKISKRVFNMVASESPSPHPVEEKILSSSLQNLSSHLSDSEIDSNNNYPVENVKQTAETEGIRVDKIKETLMSLKRKRSTTIISRDKFLDVVCEALSEYRYIGSNQRADLSLACRIRERRTSMTILLCGTSGCGKSTLSTLLASRLGITTVVSTDSIRHMMRSFVDEKDNPLLWASTYHAGEHLDLAAVAESKVKKSTKRMSGILPGNSVGNKAAAVSPNIISKNFHSEESAEDMNEPHGHLTTKKKTSEASVNAVIHETAEMVVSAKMLAVQGYKAQCEMVIDSLDRLITSWEQRCESVIVEGVHLSLNFVMGLMKKHPSIIPFMVFIENEEKHLERFAVRAKYMTLDPSKNKYVKYIRNIRAIQEYLCKRADKHLVPKVNNTNVDKSIVAIHATIFSCLRRMDAGEQLYDPISNTMKLLDQEYQNQCNANYFGSKRMLQLIQRRGSSRQLVVLVNDDGSVARAWPYELSDNKSVPSNSCFNGSAGMPIYGLPSIGKGQPVNLQFGNFGLSAFTSDLEGTSRTSSIDGLSMRGDGTEYESSHLSSSCSSSPRVGDGPDKELATVDTVSESEEEEEEAAAEDGGDPDSDEDLNTDTKKLEEEGAEGSVDEESIKSDEDEILDEQDDDDGGGAYWPFEGISYRNITSEDKHGLAAADNSKENSTTCYDGSYSSSFKGDPLTSHVDFKSSDMNYLSRILLK